MKFIVIALLLLVSKNEFSQSFSSHNVALTPENKGPLHFNDSLYRASLHERYKNQFKSKDRLEDFKKLTSESAKDMFNSNEIYTNLPVETAYLEAILKKTVPEEYFGDNLHIYIVRDPSINAYCREDGSIFVHIGLLAILDNESELAAVLSHEFGHYFSKHSLKRYKKTSNAILFNDGFVLLGWFGLVPSLINITKYYGDMRAQEKESDMFAIRLFKQNHYSSTGIISIQQKFIQANLIDNKRKGYSRGLSILSTHPSSEKRINYLMDSIRSIDLSEKNKFLVDSIAFAKMKLRAIDEVVYLQFSEAELSDCIESSYLEHLYSPKDEFYIYFVLECLRRKLDLFPATKNDYFITSRFNFKSLNTSTINKTLTSSLLKAKVGKSIHYNLDNVYNIQLASNNSSSIALHELLDTSNIEFVTNADALDYFTKIAKKTNYEYYPILKSINNNYSKPLEPQGNNELEKAFYLQVFKANENAVTNETKVNYPFFFNNYYQSVRGKKGFGGTRITSENFKDIFKNNPFTKIKNIDSCSEITILPKLNFRDTYQNAPWLDLASLKVIKDNWPNTKKIKKKYLYSKNKEIVKVKIDFESDLPELYAMSKKYGYKKLYFADILENEGDGQLNFKAQFGLLIYCVDFSKGTIDRYCYKYKPHYIGKLSDDYNAMINSLCEVFRLTK